MSDVAQLPLSVGDTSQAWDEFDRAWLALQELYANPFSTRGDRIDASIAAARAWKRWRDLYLRGAA